MRASYISTVCKEIFEICKFKGCYKSDIFYDFIIVAYVAKCRIDCDSQGKLNVTGFAKTYHEHIRETK